MRIEDDVKLDFADVSLKQMISEVNSRKDVSLFAQYLTLHSKRTIRGIPIISANMTSVSTFDMARVLAKHELFCALHKHYSAEDLINFWVSEDETVLDHTFYTLGMHDLEKFKLFHDVIGDPKLITIDVAHGAMLSFFDFVKKVRDLSPTSIIMAGNVVTPEAATCLVNSGADIVKVGVGPSKVCDTRLVAGVGIPQLSVIMETVQAITESNAYCCSDGGVINICDFGKALCAGAHFVMAGSMFAGHDECNQGLIIDNGTMMMPYYGMASTYAMDHFNGGTAAYRTAEGSMSYVPYKGKVEDTIHAILGGLRSTGSYIDAKSIMKFSDNAVFVRVNRIK